MSLLGTRIFPPVVPRVAHTGAATLRHAHAKVDAQLVVGRPAVRREVRAGDSLRRGWEEITVDVTGRRRQLATSWRQPRYSCKSRHSPPGATRRWSAPPWLVRPMACLANTDAASRRHSATMSRAAASSPRAAGTSEACHTAVSRVAVLCAWASSCPRAVFARPAATDRLAFRPGRSSAGPVRLRPAGERGTTSIFRFASSLISANLPSCEQRNARARRIERREWSGIAAEARRLARPSPTNSFSQMNLSLPQTHHNQCRCACCCFSPTGGLFARESRSSRSQSTPSAATAIRQRVLRRHAFV